MSNHADTAKMIRQDLKKAFPKIKFRVRSDTFAGGSSVDVTWINGPCRDDVMSMIHKYQYGYFDPMTDYYDINNSRDDIPQVKYVQASRQVCENTLGQVFAWLQKTHTYFNEVTSIDECNQNLLKEWSAWTARTFIYRLLCGKDLTNGFIPPYLAERMEK